jgi:hypothetical protein
MPDAQSPPARIAVANKAKCTSYLNPRVLAFMAEHGILITRLALGVNLPVVRNLEACHWAERSGRPGQADLVKLTFGYIPAQFCLYILAAWECALGLGFFRSISAKLALSQPRL